MRRFALSFTLVVAVVARISAQIPDTPAGRQFTAWRKAVDSGDRAMVQQFIDANMPFGRIDQELALARQSGGYDVKTVEESGDSRLVVLAQERGPAKQFARIRFAVDTVAPHKIAGIQIQPTQPPPALAPRKLTAAEVEAARAATPFRQLSAYLEAFNSGDRARLQKAIETINPAANLNNQMNFRERTGGLDVRAIEQAMPLAVVGLVQEHGSDQFARFVVVVDSAEPHAITRFSLNAIPRPAEFALATLSDAELAAAVRDKVEKDAAADRFAGTVLVGRIGTAQPIFAAAYGLADREKNVANTLDTRFRIGSMNKMFTATSILQLAQAGKIKLTDPVGKYITDYPNRDVATKVTIHQLLTHTGGTGDFFGPEYEAHRLELKTLGDYVKLFGARPPRFEPGTRWEYSNYGMLLLGVVIERVSKQSYYDYVAEHIYRPAGMTRTASEPESQEVAGRSIGYMRPRGGGNWTPNTNTLPYRGTSAGGGYSTVGDLMKFATALMEHRLLSAEYTALLIDGKVDTGGGGGARYAYGFEDARKDGLGSVGHSGGAPGMNGDLRIFPHSGYVVAVLSNLDPPAAQLVSGFITPRVPK